MQKLGDYIKEYSARNKLDEEIPVYSVTNSNGFCRDYFGKEVASNNKKTYKIVPRNAFAYNPSRINVGSVDYQHYEDRVIVSPLYNVFTVDERILPQYLYFYLKNPNTIKRILTVASGSVRDNLKLSMLCEFPIYVPPINKQQNIIEVLEKIQHIINEKNDELEKLDILIKARFVEMFGNYKIEKTIGEVATICRGASPRPISKFITESNGENWIKIGDVKEDDIYITKTKELVTEDGANRSRRIKPGDFILSNSMSFGRPYISKIYGCVHDGWLIVSDYEQSFLPLFFYYAIRSELVQAQFRKSVAGAVVKNLNSDLVRSVKIVIPSIESQEKFSSFAKQIDKSKFVLSNELTMCDFYIRLIHDRVMHSCINLRVAQ